MAAFDITAAFAGAGGLTARLIAQPAGVAALTGAGGLAARLHGPLPVRAVLEGAGDLQAAARLGTVTSGMKLCLPFTHESWPEVIYNIPVAASAGVDLIANATVIGARFEDHGYISYRWEEFGSQPPTTWTIEAIIQVDSAREGYIAGFAQSAAGTGVFDRTLYIADGTFGVFVGPSHAVTCGIVTRGVHHLIAVCTPTSLTLYVKGQGSVTQVTTSGGLVSYPAAPFFIVGQSTTHTGTAGTWAPTGPAATFDGVMLLACVSNEAYSDPEAQARLADPYGFLWWQQPDIEVITSADLSRGWDAGYWDVSPAPVVPPQLDALTMALFRGGYLDLRPAGVDVEYVTQSLGGTPIFALDVEADITYDDITYLTWDDTDATGFDVGVWDVTQPSFTSILTAPPVFVAGWDLGAWGTFHDPIV
jgi:hypothetical protein